MKDFQILRYLKQFRVLIAVCSVMAGFLFYYVASNKMQSYTATTVIKYTNAEAEEGLAPDGTKIDTSEIYGSYIISKVIQNLEMDPAKANMDSIRNSITITPIITEEQQKIFDADVALGKEDVSLIATCYKITFSSGVDTGKDYPRKMLNEILDVYSAYYGETHVNSARSANGVNDIYTKNYDYIEMMDVIDDSIAMTLETLSGKISGTSTFRSSETGYSFSDLYREYKLLYDVEVPQITAKILVGKVTRNREVLLSKYRNRNNDLVINTEASKEEVDKILSVIDSYVQMMSKSGNTNITSDYILQDVYDESEQVTAADGTVTEKKPDQTTSYDKLWVRYVENETGCSNNDIDTAYNEYILQSFEDAPDESPESQQNKILEEIQQLVEKNNALYNIMEQTTDEYNEYLGAANISVLSSVGVTEKISVQKFTLFVVVVFGVFGCIGAVMLGRLWDIVEYYMFTNKIVNLPNRTKCDSFISGMERTMLSSSYICVVFHITNLKEENVRLGRTAGNQMMKVFAQNLTEIFVPSSKVFVGYNDSGQYLVFADDYNPELTKASLEQFRVVLKQNCENEPFTIEYEVGYACSGEAQCFYIRKLLGIAMHNIKKAE